MGDLNSHFRDQTEEEKKHFQKAFNAGYLLNKHEPELLDRILKSPNEDKPYLQAMKAGKKQYEKDKVIEEIKEIKQSKGKEKER